MSGSGRGTARRRHVASRQPLEPIPSAHTPADDPSNYDLMPIASMNQSLFSSTKSLFKILKPLDSSGPLPGLSATGKSSADLWPHPDTQVKLEDLPDLAAACRVVDEFTAARNTVQQLTGSDVQADIDAVKQAQHLLASKPTLSFPCMMALALLDSPAKRLTVSEIYKWIKAMFPYFASLEAGSGWKNSVRHNLSLNSHFKRVSRESNGTEKPASVGKGSYWSLKSMSLPHMEDQMAAITSSSDCARRYLDGIQHAKRVVDTFAQTKPILSPSKLNATDTPRRRRRQSKSKTARARDMRELDAIAHTLLSLKSANAKGFRSKPLPSIKRTGSPPSPTAGAGMDASTRTSSAVIAGCYDPQARLSTASSSRQDETEFVVLQSANSTTTAIRRSRGASGRSAHSAAMDSRTDEGQAPPMFTFTSPMSMPAHQSASANGAKQSTSRRAGDLVARMDTATDDEINATAALLSLAGVTDVNLFESKS
ncbi:hypothetical protein PTSG_00302 [Salpingoeca rosetta]|uniref:Fork-head domain-containing protein n=1 Tax=Salpingoeca rosetta (strain ATCC 50818 / BSB-021) TaxID=946362 RepID=F2TW35_SALR5|nr:uncharacterized protein PTSG_00302 [Salpingoeca rosetta]EGD72281.1 hypothetical protein PTSG_00302 [Salpingoeca rosetta]|eukprot:XP_004998851.1 hypothetical protein PTSG_00302 [Salpingoeca rosetta]